MLTPTIDFSTQQQDNANDPSESFAFLASGIDELKRMLPIISRAYHDISAADDITAKRSAIIALVSAVHKLKGAACYLPVPQLNRVCKDFHHFLKSYTVESDCADKRTANANHYQQLLQALTQVLAQFDSLARCELMTFLSDWTSHYQAQLKPLKLFDPALTQQWTVAQRQQFALEFYHIRGHFYKLLWQLGNTAPNCPQEKQRILDNLQEEFGGQYPSHERLYQIFAEAVDVTSLDEEFITCAHQPDAIRHYNDEHLRWFQAQDWPGKLAGFAAYERLDNVDYAYLLALGKSLGVDETALTFFVQHNKADHFDQLHDALYDVWRTQPDLVKNAFDFIGNHQVTMWQKLSQSLFQ